jgi:hypothetical protein
LTNKEFAGLFDLSKKGLFSFLDNAIVKSFKAKVRELKE